MPNDVLIELPIQTRNANAIFHAGRAEGVRSFVARILHGDAEHQAWLSKAAEAFIAGRPIRSQQELKDDRCADCGWIHGDHSPDCRYYKPKDHRDAAAHSA